MGAFSGSLNKGLKFGVFLSNKTWRFLQKPYVLCNFLIQRSTNDTLDISQTTFLQRVSSFQQDLIFISYSSFPPKLEFQTRCNWIWNLVFSLQESQFANVVTSQHLTPGFANNNWEIFMMSEQSSKKLSPISSILEAEINKLKKQQKIYKRLQRLSIVA